MIAGSNIPGCNNPARTNLVRADRVRNRTRLLQAAKALFAEGGPDCSLERIARHAGLGVATLYRHFPTRQDLFEAVYQNEVEQLVALATSVEPAPPVAALRQWLHAFVEFVAAKKGMSAALAIVAQPSAPMTVNAHGRLVAALAPLLLRAAAEGGVRHDITAEDLLRTAVGLCYTHDKPGWQGNVCRLVDVFIDGMRRGADGAQT